MRIPDFFAPGKPGDGLPAARPLAPSASLAALPWMASHPAISIDLTPARPPAPLLPTASLADVKWSSSTPAISLEIHIDYTPPPRPCDGWSPRAAAPAVVKQGRATIAPCLRRLPRARARRRAVSARCVRRAASRGSRGGSSDGSPSAPAEVPALDVAEFSDEASEIEAGVLVDLAAGRLSRDEAADVLALVRDARGLLAEVGGAP